MLRVARFALLSCLALCATPTVGEAAVRASLICFGRIASPPACPRGSFSFCTLRTTCNNLTTGRRFTICSAYGPCLHIPRL